MGLRCVGGQHEQASCSRGRVILDTSTPAASCSNGDRERRFIVLPGEATVNVGGQEIDLGQHDSIYMLRGSVFEILAQSTVDNAEFPNDGENRYPLQDERA
jgi:hypothetical protein